MGLSKKEIESDVTVASSEVPVGVMLPFAGGVTTVPSGYLACDGSLVSRATYGTLFAIIGHAFNNNVDPGNNQFRLPARGVAFVNRDANQAEFNTLGKTGGEKATTLAETHMAHHRHIVDNHNHGGATGSQNRYHTHGGSTDAQGAHFHYPEGYNGFVVSPQIFNPAGDTVGSSFYLGQGFAANGRTSTDGNHAHNIGTGTESTNHEHAIGAEAPGTNYVGGNTPHNNLPPYQVVNFIIRYR